MGMDVVDYVVDHDSFCDDDRAQAKTASSLSKTQVLLGRIAQGKMKVSEAKELLKLAGEVQSKTGEKSVERFKRLEVVLQQRLLVERERESAQAGGVDPEVLPGAPPLQPAVAAIAPHNAAAAESARAQSRAAQAQEVCAGEADLTHGQDWCLTQTGAM